MKNNETLKLFHEVCTEATARLDTLKEFFFYASLEEKIEVNIADVMKLIAMIENAAKVIKGQLQEFLSEEYGVQYVTQNETPSMKKTRKLYQGYFERKHKTHG